MSANDLGSRTRRHLVLGIIDVIGRWLILCARQDADLWPLSLPVSYAVGIGLYFSWLQEPHWLIAPLFVAGCAAAAWLLRRHRIVRVLLLSVAVIGAGHGVADLSADLRVSPLLGRERGPMDVVGRVVAVEAVDQGRYRATIEVSELSRGAPPWPDRVRVRLLPGTPPETGARITVPAVLRPPSGPAYPGGFDFRRTLAFQGIGGVGYAIGAIETLESAAVFRIGQSAERLREAIALRIRGVGAEEAETAIMIALLTGERGGIPDPVLADLRDAGLAHLLAISGLHVGLVAGFVFICIRGGLALIPTVALTLPIKKIAAVAAAFAALGYMLLVGAPIPTQRAVLMVGIVLFAILVDRRAISLRLVAVAAISVLTLHPVGLVGPSFQMSFAAVIALVVVWREWGRASDGDRWEPPAWWMRPLRYAGSVLATTLVASAATAFFAIHHFQRLPLLGMVANLWAVPLTAFVIMPVGIIGLLLIPFGLEFAPFWVMGTAVGFLIDSAHWIAGIPGAATAVPGLSLTWLLVACLGGLWCALSRASWRWLGAFGPIAAVMSLWFVEPPDILIDGDGAFRAVTVGGALLPETETGNGFVRRLWGQTLGMSEGPHWTPGASGASSAEVDFSCDPLGCVLRKHGVRVAFPVERLAVEEDCVMADWVIASVPLSHRCGGTGRIDLFDRFDTEGAALWIRKDGSVRIRPVRSPGEQRPWMGQP